MSNDATRRDCRLDPPPSVLYHVTPSRNLDSILRDGLRPQIGPRSALLGEKVARVYFFQTLDSVEVALCNWLGDALDDEPGAIAVLAIDATGLELDYLAWPFEIACLHPVGPEKISLILQD